MSSKTWGPERLDPASYPEPGIDLPVFYGDLDTNGHLNNVAFGRFFEQARFTSHRQLGLGHVVSQEKLRVLVARVAIDYVGEAHFGTELHVRTRLGSFGKRSLVEQQAAWQEGRCVALAEAVLVFADEHGAVPISDAVRTLFSHLVVDSAR